MALVPFSAADTEKLREAIGPQAVDRLIRQAIATCWMMLPNDQKSTEALEGEIRRLEDRALKDLKEDQAAFGIGEPRRPARKPKRGRSP